MRMDFHVNFSGQCEEAFEFYRATLGSEIKLLTYENSPAKNEVPADWAGKVVHGSFRLNNVDKFGIPWEFNCAAG